MNRIAHKCQSPMLHSVSFGKTIVYASEEQAEKEWVLEVEGFYVRIQYCPFCGARLAIPTAIEIEPRDDALWEDIRLD